MTRRSRIWNLVAITLTVGLALYWWPRRGENTPSPPVMEAPSDQTTEKPHPVPEPVVESVLAGMPSESPRPPELTEPPSHGVTAPVSPRPKEGFQEPSLGLTGQLQLRLLQAYGRPDGTVQEDLGLVDGVLQRYWLLLKNPDLLPLGSNEDIVKALAGRNPERIEFMDHATSFIDAEGRLLDRWRTPLFFHPISTRHIEIRSAGPDLRLFSEDDIVVSAKTSMAIRQEGRDDWPGRP